ncbi:hypothetical protein Tco_0175008 [Tanacetum coccineum]
MELCTNLQQKVLDLEKTKTTQANEIASLKGRVKKLEQKKRSRTHGLKRLYKVGLTTRVESSGDEEDLELEKPLKKKDQLKLDEDMVLKLQVEIDEEERITKIEEEKIDEANIAWDDIQAKVDADY